MMWTFSKGQFIQALERMCESDSFLRRKLEALLLDLRRLTDRAHVEPALRDQIMPTAAVQ